MTMDRAPVHIVVDDREKPGGKVLAALTARGMGAGNWETCCTACSGFTFLSDYEHDSDYQRLLDAEGTFLRDKRSDDWRTQVVELARTADWKLRCPHCGTVLLDSFFHYTYAASPATGPPSDGGSA